MRRQRSATEFPPVQRTFGVIQNIYSLPSSFHVTFLLISFQPGRKEHVNIHVLTSAKAEALRRGSLRRLKMPIATVTAADEAEELLIRRGAWAVIVQDERQQKTGQLRPKSSVAGLDQGLQISRGSSCIKLALSQKHKSNT